jgi:hypothetical protein
MLPLGLSIRSFAAVVGADKMLEAAAYAKDVLKATEIDLVSPDGWFLAWRLEAQ